MTGETWHLPVWMAWRTRVVVAVALWIAAVAGAGASCQRSSPREFRARVVEVTDGDVVAVVRDSSEQGDLSGASAAGGQGASAEVPVRVRLGGLDAPEHEQPYGDRARDLIGELTRNQTVVVRVILERDDYGRIRGEVLLADGRSLNEELVRAGLAWQQSRFWVRGSLEPLEREARQAKRGLWVESSPVAPWDFKHQKR